jgi:hypothetical protein
MSVGHYKSLDERQNEVIAASPDPKEYELQEI